MNKRERVIAAFHGRQTDHVPVCMWQHVPQSFWDDDDRFAAEQTRFFKSTNVDFMKLSGDKYFDWPAPMLEGINKADDLYRIEPLGENHPFIRCQIERTKKVVAALNGECVSLYLVFVPLSCMLTSHFRCRGKAHVATYVITLINTVNLIGSWLVIRGRFFLVGVGGIAAVRLISKAIGLIALLALFSREHWELQIHDLLHPSAVWLKLILRIGFKSGMEGISYLTAQLLTICFIAGYPTASLSAKIYTQSINGYTYMTGHAIGLAAQILCGQLIGAGQIREADRLMKKSWACVLGFNLGFSLLFFAFSDRLVGLFTQSAEIRAIAHTLFMIDIITCAGRSMNHSFNLGLYSAGYAFWPMIVSIVSIWIVQVGCGYLLTVSAGLGVVGLWIAQAMDEWSRGLAVAHLWLRKKWTNTLSGA